MEFDDTLIEMVDEAEEDGIDFKDEGVELHFTLEEKPGLVFSIIITSEDSFNETTDDRNLH